MESRNLAFWTEKRNSQFWTEFGWKMVKRSPKKLSNSIEVRQKGRHCAERGCHLPLKCDTGTDFYLSPAYTCALQKFSGSIKSTL